VGAADPADRGRAAAASRLYRCYLQTAQAVPLRHAFAGQRLETPTRLLFGADDAVTLWGLDDPFCSDD
jgi:hypothetical protein